MIDITKLLAEVQKEANDEEIARAKKALTTQLRIVAQAKRVLRAEELKLQDIQTQITDGTL